MSRIIIHVDLDAFYCAIEEQRDPGLRGQPFAVGAPPEQRGVVASCSYAARRFGVRSAMPMARARALCPQLLIVPARHSAYRAASAQVMARLHLLTPFVEQISIDEAFLDVTALIPVGEPSQSGRALAQQLQKSISSDLGLSCSVGVASNKMVAKIATDYGKAAYGKAGYGKAVVSTGDSPQAICVVPAGEEAAFLASLPTSALWGVGPKTAAQLAALGLTTIGHIAQWPQRDLMRRFGSHGYDLWLHAHGIDKREVVTTREAKSISSETTFVQDLQEWDELLRMLQEQAVSVARQLQRQRLQGTTVKIKVRWSDFTTTTRQTTLPHPTDEEDVIEKAAAHLLQGLWHTEQPVRLLGVGVSGLSPLRQLSLWEPEGAGTDQAAAHTPSVADIPPGNLGQAEVNPAAHLKEPPISEAKRQRILRAIRVLQERFGKRAVRLGADIQKGE
jgi:DNA polymerase-4